jgi:hypothetical protein
MTKDNAMLIFERWRVSLRSRDRSKGAVSGNFDELFEELKKDGVDFNTAYAILPKAIKAHQPAPFLARNMYKELKLVAKIKVDEKEFIENWNQSISDKGTESFFSFFDFKEEEPEEPLVYGNMSAREYRAQRKYAESFPILDTSELEKRFNSVVESSLADEDILNVFGAGSNGETN